MKTQTQEKEKQPMKEAVQAKKSLFQLPKIGDIVEGKIIGRESGILYIDLGAIGTGVIYGVEYFRVQDELKNLSPGDTITAKVVEVENDDGYRELSLKEAEEEKSWQVLQEKYNNHETVEIKVTEANKGGLMAKVDGMEGFLPVSQLAPQNYPRVEGGDKTKILSELKDFVGKTMEVHILDLNPRDNKLIFSERAAEKKAIENSLSNYSVGDVVDGEITGVVDFGAFIKFDPLLEGLIHISELDWSLIEDPHDVVKVGDKVQAKIVDISEDGRVSLSLKALKENPWEGIEKKYKEGDKVKETVTKVNSYGALVRLEEGIQGLAHVSEFESEEEMREKLEEGKEYTFEIASVDPEEHKIGLRLTEDNKQTSTSKKQGEESKESANDADRTEKSSDTKKEETKEQEKET